jgi:AcrR family transcriptional regulator
MNQRLSPESAPTALTIRERQREVTRDAIRDAASEVASETGFAAMTMDKVAERAGVSPSTVYRYFADRDVLLGEIVSSTYGRIRVPMPSNADEIANIQEHAMAGFDELRDLFRALVISRVGQKTEWSGRQERLDMWRGLLKEVTDHLDPEEALFGQAVIVYLTGGLPWLTMADESGLDGARAGRATGWAIRTLIADLRARNEEAKRQGATTRPTSKKERTP